ncbi:MAG: hypothetical protein ACRDOI_08475 [Trebonia sp.]
MRIDPKIEKSTRDMLGHAVRGKFDELADVIETVGEEPLRECLVLCLEIAGYIAIDICGHKWPSKADVREIAQVVAGTDMDFELAESDVYDYLARSALGFEPLIEVIPDKEKVAGLPILITATLLVTYRQHETDWWDYLNEIEEALEIAAPLPGNVVPALLLLTRRNRALKERNSEANPNPQQA